MSGAPPSAPGGSGDAVYVYDGSFAGFLCCVFESFARREVPLAVWTPEQEEPTLFSVADIASDRAHAQRVWAGYCRRAGAEGRRLLLSAFLSGEPDRDICLLRFLRLVFAQGPRALALLGHADVAPVYAMDRAVGREVEHLEGFLRFEEADGMLGAVIHPKNSVLPLLRGHFCARFPEERFLIYDAAHRTALLYQDHKSALLALETPPVLPAPDEKERYYQTLWKQFYAALAIDARRNEALRRQMCAKRFWPDMTELKGEL